MFFDVYKTKDMRIIDRVDSDLTLEGETTEHMNEIYLGSIISEENSSVEDIYLKIEKLETCMLTN